MGRTSVSTRTRSPRHRGKSPHGRRKSPHGRRKSPHGRRKSPHHKVHKRVKRKTSKRSRTKPKHRHRPTTAGGRAEAARLLRSYLLSEMKERPLTRDVRDNHKKFRHFLGGDERRRLDMRVKEGRPVRGKKPRKFYSAEDWVKGSGAVQRRAPGYDGTDMKWKGVER
jgi:hypothetical protein